MHFSTAPVEVTRTWYLRRMPVLLNLVIVFIEHLVRIKPGFKILLNNKCPKLAGGMECYCKL